MIDPAKLYELSLTVGTSIRLETNCERFLAALIRLKELTAASVWLRHDLLAGNDPSFGEGREASAVLAYSRPPHDGSAVRIPLEHPIFKELDRQGTVTLSLPDRRLDGLLPDPLASEGYVAVYGLDELGFLLLHSDQRRRPFMRLEVKELEEVVGTFARSLEGCIAHHQLAREAATRRRLQAELGHREQHFRALIENALDVILLLGYDQSITFASPSVKRVLGYEPEQLLGRSLLELVHSDEVMQLFQTFRVMLDRAGPGPALEIRIRNAAGEWRSFAASAINLLSDAAVGALVLNLHDVTERNEIREALRRSEERFALSVQGSNDGIWDWDLQRDEVYYSVRWAEIVGCEEVGSRPEDWFRRVHPDDLGDLRRALDEHLAGTTDQFQHEYRIRHADGSWVWVLTRGVAIHDREGQPMRIAGSQSDVSDRVRQTAELERAREEALAASRARGEFLANMSHELRTPMNGVIGTASLLMDTMLNPEQQEFVEIVRSSGQALMAIVNDVLDLSKIESGKLELESAPFSVQQCVEDDVDMVAPTAARKDLHLVYWVEDDVPEVFVGDMVRIRQVLVNLLGNAVKFTERGEVVVTAAGHSDDDGGRPRLRFSVRDTGPGIERDVAARLFEPFTQADASTTRQYGGTGLGLAICRRLCEHMGGRIWVESVAGKGSDFRFTVTGEAAIHSRSGVEPSGLEGRRVLVADDSRTARSAVARWLRRWGAQPEAAEGADAAIAAVGDGVDAAIVDITLAGDDVNGFVERLRGAGSEGLGLVLVKPLGTPRVELALDDDLERLAWANAPLKATRLRSALLRALGVEAGPREEPERIATASSELPETEQEAMRVLVVEDNPVNRRLATMMLERLGHRAETASTGAEAVAACADRRFEIVLMDVQMPGMDGFEATRRIRDLEDRPQPYIIANTAHAMAGDRERCLSAGMDDYLSKPIQLHDLRASLRRAIGASAESSVDPLDTDRIAQIRSIGRDGLLEEMIGLFLGETPDRIAEIRRAAEDGDDHALRTAAHTLKGSALALGAGAVASVCQELESMGEAGRLHDTGTAIDRLDTELERLRGVLEDVVEHDGVA
jgi:PAS domain S-box-containing protein